MRESEREREREREARERLRESERAREIESREERERGRARERAEKGGTEERREGKSEGRKGRGKGGGVRELACTHTRTLTPHTNKLIARPFVRQGTDQVSLLTKLNHHCKLNQTKARHGPGCTMTRRVSVFARAFVPKVLITEPTAFLSFPPAPCSCVSCDSSTCYRNICFWGEKINLHSLQVRATIEAPRYG